MNAFVYFLCFGNRRLRFLSFAFAATAFVLPLSAQEVSDDAPVDSVSHAAIMENVVGDGAHYCPPAGLVPLAPQDCSADIARRQTGDLVTWLQGMCDLQRFRRRQPSAHPRYGFC